jgi:tetratricopeptide (TPR) repeat protein
MHAAGVRCLDCHAAHTAKTILPGDLLCLRCHSGSVTNAPIISPAQHAFHKLDTPGGRCVDCHMPTTTYMQRHPRRDHGFTVPDPLLTKEHGIPNACNRCHQDKSADWALALCNQWYGEDKMDRPARRRTRIIAAARQHDPGARDALLRLLQSESSPYWQASIVQLLEYWLQEAAVANALSAQLTNSSPLVRSHAARILESLVQAGDRRTRTVIEQRLDDPDRSVRIAAAWALRGEAETNTLAFRELARQMAVASDQPGGQLQLGAWQLARGNPDLALAHYQKAAAWDSGSAPVRHELAIALSLLGRHREALEQLQTAVRLDPDDSDVRYKLALAWNEVGDLNQAISTLEETVRRSPQHARAWYNLGLARAAQQQTAAALDALLRAESLAPTDPAIPYARATVLVKLGRATEARLSARRALELQPDSVPARELLRTLTP